MNYNKTKKNLIFFIEYIIFVSAVKNQRRENLPFVHCFIENIVQLKYYVASRKMFFQLLSIETVD